MFPLQKNSVLWEENSNEPDKNTFYNTFIPFLVATERPLVCWRNIPEASNLFLYYCMLLAIGRKSVFIVCNTREQLENTVAAMNDTIQEHLNTSIPVVMPQKVAMFWLPKASPIFIGPMECFGPEQVIYFPYTGLPEVTFIRQKDIAVPIIIQSAGRSGDSLQRLQDYPISNKVVFEWRNIHIDNYSINYYVRLGRYMWHRDPYYYSMIFVIIFFTLLLFLAFLINERIRLHTHDVL